MNDFQLSHGDFQRLEKKLDSMSEKVEALILIEERQTGHSDRLKILEARSTALEDHIRLNKEALSADILRANARIDKWLHLGMGGWTAAVVAFEAFRVYKGF